MSSSYFGRVFDASVDGVDVSIFEPVPFDRKWYSHKSNTPALRYEVAVSIEKGEIVWINGPFPAGESNDLQIFRRGLKYILDLEEVMVADKGYPDASALLGTDVCICQRNLDRSIRARHESLNGRLKSFHVLSQRYRHDLSKHSICFFAICKIVQFSISEGNTLFSVDRVSE